MFSRSTSRQMSEGFKSYRNALFIATLSSRSQKRAPPIIFSFSLSLSLLLPTITRAKGFLPSLLLAIQKKKNTIVNTERHRRENKRDKKNIINLVDDSHCAYISNIHTRIYYYESINLPHCPRNI